MVPLLPLQKSMDIGHRVVLPSARPHTFSFQLQLFITARYAGCFGHGQCKLTFEPAEGRGEERYESVVEIVHKSVYPPVVRAQKLGVHHGIWDARMYVSESCTYAHIEVCVCVCVNECMYVPSEICRLSGHKEMQVCSPVKSFFV